MFQQVIFIYLITTVLSSQAAPLKLDIETRRSDGKELSSSYLHKRSGLKLPVSNEYSVYTTIVQVGSNRDPVRVILDTGSSDFWVMSSEATCVSKEIKQYNIFDRILTGLNRRSYQPCMDNGAFNYLNSTSFVKNDTEPFSISYIDGVSTTGFWGYDNVMIPGTSKSISNLSFAIADKTSSKIGVMGIGLPESVSPNTKYGKPYENLPLKLKTLGIINTSSYSVYMYSSKPPSYGAILFSAIDHEKYSGNLTTMDIYNDPTSLARLRIPITSMEMINGTNMEKITSKGPNVLLDTGCTFSRFTRDIVESISKLAGGHHDKENDYYIVDCNIPSSVVLRLIFKGQPIDFPVNELLRAVGDKCILGLDIDDSNTLSILGDNFLRRMYMYFDLENKQISVAQAVYTNREDIELISGDNFKTQGNLHEEDKSTSLATDVLYSLPIVCLSVLVFAFWH